jgi:hypothetical protein
MSSIEFEGRRASALAKGITEGSVWYHYKGGTYKVIGFGVDTDSGEFKVVYQRIYGPVFHAIGEANRLFFRSPSEWLDAVGETTRFRRLRA